MTPLHLDQSARSTHDQFAAFGAGVELAVVEAHAGDIAALLGVVSDSGDKAQRVTHLLGGRIKRRQVPICADCR